MRFPLRSLWFTLLLLASLAACARPPQPATAPAAAAPAAPQVQAQAEERPLEADAYSLYELLGPETNQFRILYEVTAIDPGAAVFFNPIRKGSEASDESVRDRATGQALQFEEVSGEEARASGLPRADLDTRYIRIHLPRPVPRDGGVRLLIEKTYKDPKSYRREGADRIVFFRTLGVRRNAVVLPAGYEVVSCNVPSQVLAEPDGRFKVSLMHTGPEALPVRIEARRTALPAPAPKPASSPDAGRLAERAHQDRTIVYFLRDPETHSFDLYHDYTESRPGIDRYLNVVRKGSTASSPSARNLDTGETLQVETVKGDELIAAGLREGEEVEPGSEVVVARFPPPPPGGSVRIRISETYTDPKSYRVEDGELVFDRALGRPYNAVVLPAGWALTATSMPAMVSETPEGRVRLDFVNPRPDNLGVLIKARKR